MAIHQAEVHIPRAGYLGGGTWELSALSDVTVLFGKNGSGKSVMLRAWRDMAPETTHYVTPERTGEMDFQPQYLQQELTHTGRKDSSSKNYVPEYRRRIISRIQSYFLTRGNYRGEGKAPSSPSEIESFINSLVTDFMVELVAAKTPPYELSRAADGAIIGGVDQLSSGEAQLVTIALDVLTIAAIWEIEEKPRRIILIDEPDAHIHPDLQVRFADFLFRVAERYSLQIAIATHSTSLLAALGQFGGSRTSAIYVVRGKTNFDAQPFSDIHKELSACLGGHVLMGPLFGTPILLVEGDDDYRIWSQVPRHHVTNLAVIPSMGEEIKRYQRALENIFKCLREADQGPCGYALVDGDKPKPHPSAQNTQDHIRFIQLNCHEAENLFLTDQVLNDLSTNWTDAANLISSRAPEFGEKAPILASAHKWDRRTSDLKNVIEQVSLILDPKAVHWTTRVGRAIGRQRPEGDLAEFLGAEVIAALWPSTPQPAT